MDNKDVADVLIVGGGTSAGVAAKHLAEAGFKVVCLEQGDWISQSDIPGDKIEFELLNSKQWSADPNIRGRRQDYPTDLSESEMPVWMFNGVGGSSILWGRFGRALCHRILEYALWMALPMIGRLAMKSYNLSMRLWI